MPPELPPSDEEEYLSDEDSDFAPDAIPAQPDSDSEPEPEPEDEASSSKPLKKRKYTTEDAEAEDLGFENSGDEAIIGDGLKEKKKRKKGKKGKGGEDEEEGGEGGFVKTRSMRAVEEVKKKPLADTTTATIDVDAVFAAMISGKPLAPPPKPTSGLLSPPPPKSPEIQRPRSSSTFDSDPDSMIMIKRTYTFAGKLHTEQKLVPRNSAEAQLFLSSQSQTSKTSKPDKDPSPAEPTTKDPLFTKPKRPLQLARRSIFEPILDSLPQRTDLHFGIRRSETGIALSTIQAKGKEKKLNTVEKSAVDWAGFVDKEGIKDELDAAGKSKGAYKARQEFLARVEEKKVREERERRGLPAVL